MSSGVEVQGLVSFSARRIAAGLTLDDVAKEFGVEPDSVREWEEGKSKPPSHVDRSLDIITRFAAEGLADAKPCRRRPGQASYVSDRSRGAGSSNTQSGQTKISNASNVSLIKSKKRVADHGEVFTPPWLVEKMLDLVKGETERINSRFLEPACGSGNFLVPILQRKLAAVEAKYGRSDFEKQQYALLALACCYGIELLKDNIDECRANMLEVFAEYLGLKEGDELYRAASHVLSLNLIHGDAMKMENVDGGPITVVEWSYLGKAGKFNRRDFQLKRLTERAGFAQRWIAPDREQQVSLFSEPRRPFHQRGRDPIFIPISSHPPMTIRQLAALDVEPAA